MWIELNIATRKYFLLCQIVNNDAIDEVDCVLYDGKTSFHEHQTLSIILKRAKELNKKIAFDEASIKETLQKAQPVEVKWESTDDEITSLKLKYRVQSCPFNFIWNLSEQTEHEFQRFILFPLFRIVQGLTQQNDELREVIKKKDVELKQFKIEGAVLKRVTVSTQPFNFTAFDEKFAETIALTSSIMQISDPLKKQYSEIKTSIQPRVNAKEEAGEEEANNEQKVGYSKDLKLTPRRKRRKFLEEKQRATAEELKVRNKGFTYESSQSQPTNSSHSESESTPSVQKEEKPFVVQIEKPNVQNTEKQQTVEETPSPSKLNRKPIDTEKVPSPSKKSKPICSLQYESDSSSSTEDEKVNKVPESKKFTLKQSPIKPVLSSIDDVLSKVVESSSTKALYKTQSPIESIGNSTDTAMSEDVQSLIDEWKALEKRRVTDLNARERRHSKRLS